MKHITWDNEKNSKLKETRGVSFEDIIYHISNGDIVDIIDNPNYDNQSVYIININSYIYIVPFVDNGEEIFLKTIYPSRKATKMYLSKE